MNLAELERRLLARIPAKDAEEWDHVGCSVGDPAERVTGILCALDPTPAAVEAARDRGANVLLTHHPVYLEAPDRLSPEPADSTIGAATLWKAIERGVALIALHTNLDRSEEALRFFGELLELPYLGRATGEGYGALVDGSETTISELLARLEERLGARPAVWARSIDESTGALHRTSTNGPRGAGVAERRERELALTRLLDKPAGRVAYLSGSAGSLALDAASGGASVIVCGEESYHRLMELINKKTPNNDNLVVVVIGHDVSELPYARLLERMAGEVAPDVPRCVFEEGIHWRIL